MASELHIGTGTDSATLVLSGQLDSQTAPKLQERLEEWGASRPLAVDLAGIDFIDRAGLDVLISARKAHEDARNSMALDRPSNAVVSMFEIADLTDHLKSD